MSKNIVNQRFIKCINFLLESKKVPSKSFLAEIFNISNPKFSEILKERMNVGVDILMILVSKFDISSEWLLTGQGSMLKEPAQPVPVQEVQPSNNDKYIAVLEAQLKDKEEKEALLKDKIADLERRLAFAEVKDKEEMSLKIKTQRKENKAKDEIILAQTNTINELNEENNALKSRHLPPDEPLQPAKGL